MRYLYITLILFVSTSIFGKTTSSTTGDWTDIATWSNGVPVCGDTIIISSGTTVRVNAQVDLSICADSTWLKIEGTLTFKNGSKLQLSDGSVVHVYTGGILESSNGGGNSVYISINGTPVWTAADPDITSDTVLDNGSGSSSFPVEMLLFEALEYSSSIKLIWQTASEMNSAYFQIEWSTDALTWKEVGRIESAGNSNQIINYLFVDETPINGPNYYRLKQVDFDGAYEYFGPIYQDFNSNSKVSSLRIYPNPNNKGILELSLSDNDEPSILQIYNCSGRLIREQQLEQNSTLFNVDISELPKGIYILKYSNISTLLSKKLIVN